MTDFRELPGRGSLYQNKEWFKMRARQLRREPFCRYCAALNMQTKATHADHVTPHRGKRDLFFDENNLQSLCTICHNAAKQREEVRRTEIGCEADGWPRGADHAWNSGKFVNPIKR